MITDRDDLYDLAIDVHDCAGSRAPRHRAAAVRRLELPRLRAPGRGRARAADAARRPARADAREPARGSPSASRALPGLTLRRPNDDGGDAGICLIAFAADRGARRRGGRRAAAPRASRAMRIYDPAFADLHVYPYWAPVLDAIATAGSRRPTARARSTCSSARSTSTSRRSATSRTSTRSRSRSRRSPRR